MVDTTRLIEKVKESGYRTAWLAEQLDISPAAWSLKLNNKRGFKPEEVKLLCKLLKINSLRERDEIFFA